jgi:hypothetical protein
MLNLTYKDFNMVKDDDTAYDEVIIDINSLIGIYVKNKDAKNLITKKLQQLLRIFDDDENKIT